MSGDGYIYVRHWEEFQHYKDRNPAWIKSYTALLRDDDYYELSFHDRGLLHGLWLLAASCGNGRVSASSGFLRSQLGQGRIKLDTLLAQGWISIQPDKAPAPQREWASRYIPDDVRTALFADASHKCQDCGGRRNLEIDHILPVSRGGSGDPENLRVLCRACNRRKQAKTPEEYKEWMTSTEHLRSTSHQSGSLEKEKNKSKRKSGASEASTAPLENGIQPDLAETAPLTREQRQREAQEALARLDSLPAVKEV
jgi:hypothetical protein